MAERSTISQAVQIGVETTPGTAVAANKRLGSIGFNLAPKVETNPQRPIGQKYANLQILGKEWSEASLEGAPCYTELPYVLSSLFSTATTTAVLDGATPTGATKWTFNSNAFGADNPKTFTVEQGSSVRAHRAANVIIAGLTFNYSREEVTLEGTAIARALEDGITLTSSPTQLPQIPVRPTECTFYLDNTAAALGTTKLTRALSASWELSSRFGPLWVVDASLPSFVTTVETEPTAQFTLMQEADAEGMANLTVMRNGTTKFMRIEAVGPTIYTGGVTVKHQFRLDLAGQVADVGDFSDEDGVYAIEWTFGNTVDATWAKAFSAEVITTTATL